MRGRPASGGDQSRAGTVFFLELICALRARCVPGMDMLDFHACVTSRVKHMPLRRGKDHIIDVIPDKLVFLADVERSDVTVETVSGSISGRDQFRRLLFPPRSAWISDLRTWRLHRQYATPEISKPFHEAAAGKYRRREIFSVAGQNALQSGAPFGTII